MTGQTATAPVMRCIQSMKCFFLPQMATGALLAQQAVSRRMAQCCQLVISLVSRFQESLTGAADNPGTGVHEAVRYSGYFIRMTAATNLLRAVHIARKGNQLLVGRLFLRCIGIASMALSTAQRKVAIGKALLPVVMAIQAGRHRSL